MCQLIFIWHYPEFIKSIMTCFLCPGEPTSKLGGLCQACGRLHWGRHIHLCWHPRLQVGENSHPTTNSNLRTYLSFNHFLTEDPKECGPWRRRDWSQAWMYHGMMWENIDFILCQCVLFKLCTRRQNQRSLTWLLQSLFRKKRCCCKEDILDSLLICGCVRLQKSICNFLWLRKHT